MEKLQKTILLFSILVLLGLGVIGYLLIGGSKTIGTVFKDTMLLNAVTSTTTSSAINIKGAKKVTFLISDNIYTASRATSTVGFMVSVDGTTYVNYNKLIDNATNTNAQTLTRVETKSFSATGTSMLSMDLTNDTFAFVKASTTQTYGTGGILGGLTVKSIIEF